jgi:hypothetical protein
MMKVVFFSFVIFVCAVLCTAADPPPREEAGFDYRLVSKERHNEFMKLLPRTESKELQALFSKNLIFYTDEEMPKAYQHSEGLHDPRYNISATKPKEPHGNPNIEFPWGGPAGTHRCDNMKAFRFVHLPDAITYWNEKMPVLTAREFIWVPGRGHVGVYDEWGIRWEYPEKTTFAEVLMVTDGKSDYPFEVRTRTKTDGKWVVNLYRPMLTRAELEKWLEKNDSSVKLNTTYEKKRLKNRHPTTVIDVEAVVDELPAMSSETVKKILALPFRSALGQEWVTHEGVEGHAPTTKAKFGIVPRNYDGAFLRVDSKACMQCHEGVLKDADDFERNRDWYGRVRGSDGIFSFHIFSPASINDSGFSHWPKLRKSLVDSGLVKLRAKK